MRPAVQALAPGLRAMVQETLELGEGAAVHLALEVDHVVERKPVVVPAPGVKLGMIGGAQGYVAVAADQA